MTLLLLPFLLLVAIDRSSSQAHATDPETQSTVSQQVGAPAICPVGQFLAEYFDDPNASADPAIFVQTTPTYTACEASIDHDWSGASPAPGITGSSYLVRWTGSFDLVAGNYTFTTLADDGLRLNLDNSLLLDAWRDRPVTQDTVIVPVDAGQHTIRVEHYERSCCTAVVRVQWQVGLPFCEYLTSEAVLTSLPPLCPTTPGAPGSAMRKDPVNLIFTHVSLTDLLGLFDTDLGWFDPGDLTCTGPPTDLYFIDHGNVAVQDAHRVDAASCERGHLRLKVGSDGSYILGAAHRDVYVPDCYLQHLGAEFDETRDSIAAAFQQHGYTVTWLVAGNTLPTVQPCRHTTSSSDGKIALIDIGSLPAAVAPNAR